MEFNNYFFIKIRKSGGTTLMNLLNDNNLKKNIKQPKPFILAKKKEYNSVINNYRIPLGKYQGKRCLFAKEILFPNEWDNIFSFALSRPTIMWSKYFVLLISSTILGKALPSSSE